MLGYEIIYELKRAGISQQRLAVDLSVSHGAINNVIHGRSTCRHIAEQIAARIGKHCDEIWPGRYQKRRKTSITDTQEHADEMNHALCSPTNREPGSC